ncbi:MULTISPECIES: ROK family glucokinase [unclassified Granulicatella]|uniref:ROK family glucokinase n=1 Tax=unclassified Granulicatella TaxID=2630493 RepID=UPI00107306FE|nr:MULTISPECIES: ROK family glucokinase [unclassified Granulicatella]MBF0780990.1 ROK family glucokinase [Granulicatella sp. 19428wC4_WM01]TFU92721.1 ROK family glucokinase [Granulicatella sp. WM01]
MQKIIGVDLGGTSVKMAIVSLEGEVLTKWSISTNKLDNGQHIVKDIIQSIQQHLDLYSLNASDIKGIGIGSPGAIDKKKGSVTGAYNLGWASEQPVRALMQEALQIPVFIENDANVATLGERWKGAGLNADDMVLVTLGTGVGGGIVTNGKLVNGSKNCAGEIGHILIDAHGLNCTCGKKGCLETVASATGIVQLARQHSDKYAEKTTLKNMIDDGIVSAKDIFDYAKCGDKLAQLIVNQFAEYLGIACSHIANMLNPRYIVIGGGVSGAGEFLIQQVNKYFEKYVLTTISNSTELVLATLGNDAGAIGAASLVLSESE